MQTNRRNFLKIAGITMASLPFLGSLRGVTSANAADALPLAKESDPLPKSLGYCANAEKAASPQCKNRKAKEKADQFCHNCQLFTKTQGEGKKAVGKCMIMPQNSVPGNAWCNSWVKRPG